MCYYAVGTTNVASEQYELLLEGVLKSSHTQLSLWWTKPPWPTQTHTKRTTSWRFPEMRFPLRHLQLWFRKVFSPRKSSSFEWSLDVLFVNQPFRPSVNFSLIWLLVRISGNTTVENYLKKTCRPLSLKDDVFFYFNTQRAHNDNDGSDQVRRWRHRPGKEGGKA